MQALFEAVRQACSPDDWSHGVELSRGGTVVVDHAIRDEVRLRISTRSGMISPTVTLWPRTRIRPAPAPVRPRSVRMRLQL